MRHHKRLRICYRMRSPSRTHPSPHLPRFRYRRGSDVPCMRRGPADAPRRPHTLQSTQQHALPPAGCYSISSSIIIRSSSSSSSRAGSAAAEAAAAACLASAKSQCDDDIYEACRTRPSMRQHTSAYVSIRQHVHASNGNSCTIATGCGVRTNGRQKQKSHTHTPHTHTHTHTQSIY